MCHKTFTHPKVLCPERFGSIMDVDGWMWMDGCGWMYVDGWMYVWMDVWMWSACMMDGPYRAYDAL